MCFRRAAFIHYERAVTSLVAHTCPSLSALSQVLGRFDMAEGYQNPSVAEEQAAVQVAPDGSSIMVYALGQNPTGWRTRPDEAWRWLEPGQSQVRAHSLCGEGRALARESPLSVSRPTRLSPRSQELQSGWKVNLDCQYPESAVYKVQPCATYPPYNVGAPKPGAYGGQQSYGGQQGYGGQGGGQGGLPFGWTSGVDQQSGQTYYYNEQTGQSQWDPPR